MFAIIVNNILYVLELVPQLLTYFNCIIKINHSFQKLIQSRKICTFLTRCILTYTSITPTNHFNLWNLWSKRSVLLKRITVIVNRINVPFVFLNFKKSATF